MLNPAAPPDLSRAQGRWLDRRFIAWPLASLPPGLDPTRLDWTLHWSPTGSIDVWAPEPYEWDTATLRVHGDPLPRHLAAGLPHPEQAVVLRVPTGVDVGAALRGPVVVAAQQRSGRLVNAGALQIAGVLDDLYAAAVGARLGVTFAGGVPTLRVWAPTALEVELLLWGAGVPLTADPTPLPMTREPDGCWSIVGDASWVGRRYLYSVRVFATDYQRVVTNRVTDPYSVALGPNSVCSVIADLDDPALAPALWADTPQPALASPVDQVIYELHVRDFSEADETLPDEVRGTYLAFAHDGHGSRHLKALADAGLNTVQLLPIFDFTSIEEQQARRTPVDRDRLRTLPPDSEEQQRYLSDAHLRRSYNWGYDPWHYFVPEGSFATDAGIDGAGRTVEVRTMIGALHALGLRVVLDQVFSHTTSAGQDMNSVLGRLVPGYYHRRDDQGRVYTSTCCPNVATEHLMAEKLMVDACVLWARRYKVDGFRFDLMGHHSRSNMLKVRAALDALTPEADGVDGRQVTMYGEGWSFGEVANNALFVQARQGQLGGTHIATFSDRLRDAVRGGSPFDPDPRVQGFGNGLATTPNASPANGNQWEQRDRLLHFADLIQVGLAGSLRDARFCSQRYGQWLRGDQIDYNGSPAGYADHPDEVINYVDAHDNETLFDALTLKLPVDTSMPDRIRANTFCLALPTLGQSAVLWHAGTDFLRSKSLDRNSYDSGDWFNYLDFSLTDNGFGAGLPPAADNKDKWPYMRPLLGLAELKPRPADMRQAHALALDLLRLRASTRLFRLGDPEQVKAKVSFPVSGSWTQVPGVILMLLDDAAGEPVDERWRRIAVVFNGTAWPVRQQAPALAGGAWVLHPVQVAGSDPVVRSARADDGVFMVPGRTVAVFVEER